MPLFFFIQKNKNNYSLLLPYNLIFLNIQYLVISNRVILNYIKIFYFLTLTFSGIAYKITKYNKIIKINTTKQNTITLFYSSLLLRKLTKKKIIFYIPLIQKMHPKMITVMEPINKYNLNGCRKRNSKIYRKK